MRFLFRSFGCLTVVVFFFGLGVYLLVTTNPPAPPAALGIQEVVYPVARATLKERVDKTLKALLTRQPNQELVIRDMEANAYLNSWFADPERAVLREFYVSFRDDGDIRVRFDVSLENLKRFILGRIRGGKLDETLGKLARASHVGRALVITLDLHLYWTSDGHPLLALNRVYIGMLPLPIAGLVNDYMINFNRMLGNMVDEWNRKMFFLVREVEVKDTMLVIRMQAKVTDEYMRQAQMRKFREDNQELFKPQWLCQGSACTRESQERIEAFAQELYGKNIHQINRADVERMRLLMQRR